MNIMPSTPIHRGVLERDDIARRALFGILADLSGSVP
jgi:hypothetical protein